jgi:hypothetical protein
MLKPKTPRNGCFFSSGARIRTWDLRVMSPTSYLCSTPHRRQDYKPVSTFRQAALDKIETMFYDTFIN